MGRKLLKNIFLFIVINKIKNNFQKILLKCYLLVLQLPINFNMY